MSRKVRRGLFLMPALASIALAGATVSVSPAVPVRPYLTPAETATVQLQRDAKTRVVVDVHRVDILLTVTDGKGRFITELVKDQFEVIEDDRPSRFVRREPVPASDVDGVVQRGSAADTERRSELWILLKDDIGIVRKGGNRHIVTRSDVQVVNVGGGHRQQEQQPDKPNPRILQIVDEQRTTGLSGFYIRLPDTAFSAYGDLLPTCESRGVVWAGNKILYVASDTVGAAFQYEIRLDEVVAANVDGIVRAEGARQLDRPLQEMYGGIYFPIPAPLEPFLVPHGNAEIRLELHCDWIDMRTARHWTPKSE